MARPPIAEAGFAALPGFLRESLGRKRWGWRFDTREKQIQRTKDYWRMTSGVDRALGRVLRVLDERGLADDTVIVFTSDNGYFLGERGLAGKWLIYEESIRVPLLRGETPPWRTDFLVEHRFEHPKIFGLPSVAPTPAPPRSPPQLELVFEGLLKGQEVGALGARWGRRVCAGRT